MADKKLKWSEPQTVAHFKKSRPTFGRATLFDFLNDEAKIRESDGKKFRTQTK